MESIVYLILSLSVLTAIIEVMISSISSFQKIATQYFKKRELLPSSMFNALNKI